MAALALDFSRLTIMGVGRPRTGGRRRMDPSTPSSRALDEQRRFSLALLTNTAQQADDTPSRVPRRFPTIEAYADVMRRHVVLEHNAVLTELADQSADTILMHFVQAPDEAKFFIDMDSDSDDDTQRTEPVATWLAAKPGNEESPCVSENLVRTLPSGKLNYLKSISPTAGGDYVLTLLYPVPLSDNVLFTVEYCGSTIQNYKACLKLPTLPAGPVARAVLDPDNIAECNQHASWHHTAAPRASNAFLNQAQRTAVDRLARAIECVHGPPGTGKSTLISAVIEERVPADALTFVVCVRNRAVDSIADKLHAKGVRLIVFGNERLMGPTAISLMLDKQVEVHPYVLLHQRVEQTLQQWVGRFHDMVERRWEEAERTAGHWISGRGLRRVDPRNPPPEEKRQAVRERWRAAIKSAWLQANPRPSRPKKAVGYGAMQLVRSGVQRVRAAGQAGSYASLQAAAAVFRRLRHLVRMMKSKFEAAARSDIIARARCILSTVDSSGRAVREVFAEAEGAGIVPKTVHSVIVDEAGCMPEYAMPLLLNLRPECLLLIGDPDQLQPFTKVDDVISEELQHARSLLERAKECGLDLHFMDTQYRMIPPLCELVSDKFYDGRLVTAPAAENLAGIWAHHAGLFWANSISRHEDNMSNPGEADRAVAIAKALRQQYPTKQIYLLSFYKKQVRLLQSKITASIETLPGGSYRIGTVNHIGTTDSTQGDEADIVIISLSRADGANEFLINPNRLCVAMSRARKTLIIVGNQSNYLRRSLGRGSRGDRVWAHVALARSWPGEG
eukprot:m.34417 g.34417  ORF g.34417 m.34417 type:complete len:788 (-) comp5214_c0_seq1:140-2503(-)